MSPTPRSLNQCFTVDDLRALAKARLPRAVFDFYDGGAEDEQTLKANRAAFEQLRWRPQVLRNVSTVHCDSALFGRPLGLPLAIAPTGAAGFGHPDADIGLAQAAARRNIPYTLSSSATTSIEVIADKAGGRLWFQAYVLKDQAFFWKMVDRARVAGYESLIITVDLAVGGKRVRDLRNHFGIPFRFTARNAIDFASCPRWLTRLLYRGMPTQENMRGMDGGEPTARGVRAASALASSVGRNHDASFDFDRLAQVRDRWPGRLIVKGVNRGDDAARLVQLGCDALVVSNHGGRQLDGGRASLEALPEVLAGVAGRIPVWMDGGVRHGGDIARAIAMGAGGVLVGRATLYGAVAQGPAGAQRALDILEEELRRTLALCGVTRIADLSADLLASR